MAMIRCLCPYPDPVDDNTCACGDALDEHDETGQCQAEHDHQEDDAAP